MANSQGKSWSEKAYRGRTSLNLMEALGLTNKQAAIGTIAVVGGLALLIYVLSKRPSGGSP
jgi:hypothetical protein